MNRLWLLAALGGLLGGSVRGVFMLIAESFAFEYRCRTGESSEWALLVLAKRCGLGTLEDRLDPLTNWWAYLLKPVLGMGFGFAFGLLQLLGLVPFLQAGSAKAAQEAFVVIVAVLAGILTEEALSFIQSLFAGRPRKA